MKYVSIDIETCGINPMECDILEFGAVLDDLKEKKPLEQLSFFHCYFVKERYVGEPFALSMHKTIFERIAARGEEEVRKRYNFFSADKFGHSFKQFLINNGYKSEKDRVSITAAGKNFGPFDLQFLRYKTDLEKHVNIRSTILDPAILFLQGTDEKMPGLAECKRRAGFEEMVMHDSINDAKDVIRLLRQKLRPVFN